MAETVVNRGIKPPAMVEANGASEGSMLVAMAAATLPRVIKGGGLEAAAVAAGAIEGGRLAAVAGAMEVNEGSWLVVVAIGEGYGGK